MKRTRIKICGITSVDDARLVVESGCDAIGLVFYDKSPRVVTIEEAVKIRDVVPAFVTLVALFVNASDRYVETVIEKVSPDLLQFHGDESEHYCAAFSRPYIKAIPVKADKETSDSLSSKLETGFLSARAILLDSYDPLLKGGTGKVFDWGLLSKTVSRPLILAGGLTSENIQSAINQVSPFAIDVSGGVEKILSERNEKGKKVIETEKGKKDQGRIRAVVGAVRLADS